MWLEDLKYFQIKAFGSEYFPHNMHILTADNSIFVSPQGRLSGKKIAAIGDRETAEKFCTALTAKFRHKYGSGITLNICDVRLYSSRTDEAREKIEKDTAAVRDWLSRQQLDYRS